MLHWYNINESKFKELAGHVEHFSLQPYKQAVKLCLMPSSFEKMPCAYIETDLAALAVVLCKCNTTQTMHTYSTNLRATWLCPMNSCTYLNGTLLHDQIYSRLRDIYTFLKCRGEMVSDKNKTGITMDRESKMAGEAAIKRSKITMQFMNVWWNQSYNQAMLLLPSSKRFYREFALPGISGGSSSGTSSIMICHGNHYWDLQGKWNWSQNRFGNIASNICLNGSVHITTNMVWDMH